MRYDDNMPIIEIRKMIEQKLDAGFKQFIIYPYGAVGMKVKDVLNSAYNIQEFCVIDNHLSRYNPSIKPFEYLQEVKLQDKALLLSTNNINIYAELKANAEKYFTAQQIGELEGVDRLLHEKSLHPWMTKVGKYSFGPICQNHDLIKEIGAFCSFAQGVDVVPNHPRNMISTHCFLYKGTDYEDGNMEYENFNHKSWYFEGVHPHETAEKRKRITIGNDVWLGKNVIITNYANIGNGVIGGAGAIITKDVPDYAIVAGCPARIIRYRFTPQQIEGLNKISWWDWPDDVIRQQYDDFYLPVDEFIKKYIE